MSEWVERSGSPMGGQDVRRWLERPVPGEPGCVERRYLDADANLYRICGEPIELVGGGSRTRSQSLVLASPRAPMQVVITEWAWEQMFREQYTDLGLRGIGEGVEIAGGGFGYIDGNTFVIADLTGRSYNNSYGRCAVDLEFIDRMSVRHAETTGYRLICTWQAHPTIDGPGYALASPADLSHWASMKRASRSDDPFLGLIITPRHNDYYGWTSPMVTAIVVRHVEPDLAAAADPHELEFARVEVENNPGRGATLPNDAASWRL